MGHLCDKHNIFDGNAKGCPVCAELAALQAENKRLRETISQATIELEEAELGEGFELNLRNLACRLQQALKTGNK